MKDNIVKGAVVLLYVSPMNITATVCNEINIGFIGITICEQIVSNVTPKTISIACLVVNGSEIELSCIKLPHDLFLSNYTK
ncbi:hypothetical protein A1G_03855 [Rickettsia rickettsii str. 'Sheila Smith']|uniref:Uncharacterized protein n=1 Tax=Rickettsia rickettsii (strain Sheila Smith) TaxID=392021 RepID=A0A0H3AX18_RICRS|nr:hypothetical protein A1G_03855 [Rickettsia rickettsii str. 'Sheila Smith']